MRRLFIKTPLNLLPQVKDRYPFVYLEYGRLEVDDSSVKWISSKKEIIKLPVAVLSSLLMGPGTSITHAAIHAVSEAGCMICWVGAESLKFYAAGITPTSDTRQLYGQLQLAMDETLRVEVARKMFGLRFPEADLKGKSLQSMMGMEGVRVRRIYAEMAEKYGVVWQGRNYLPGQTAVSDPVNRVLTIANSMLYGIVTSMIYALGYSPRVGFIHSGSPLPFTYDIADFYKADVCIDLAFALVAKDAEISDRHTVINAFRDKVLECQILERIADDIRNVLSMEGQKDVSGNC